jgi:type IV pilus assembly protein PilA
MKIIEKRESFLFSSSFGFTLIELMLVIGIIGILAGVSVPSYSNIIAKSQVADGLTQCLAIKQNIEDYYAYYGILPEDNKAAGVLDPEELASNYVASIEVEDGAIHMTFGNRANQMINGLTLTLRPAMSSDFQMDYLIWHCGNENQEGMMPVGENKTSTYFDNLNGCD